MEILVDRYKVVESEIYRFKEEDRTLYSSIRSVKERSVQVDMIVDAITDLMMKANFACADFELGTGNRYDGYPLRVYNGKYWEHVGSFDVRDSVLKYLRMQGLGCVVSGLNNGTQFIHNTILSTCRKKILHPRLTLMCFRNGVVDFGRIETRPMLKSHNPKYDVIKMYDFKYDPLAYRESVIWKNFLGEPIGHKKNEWGVLPEDVKRRQLQLFLGSLLIPRAKVKFEYFMIMQGTGGNGKSVIFQVLEMLFGKEEVCALDVSQFTRMGDEKLRAMASLVGKRMLYCPEELIKSLKNIQGLKSIVSGETQQFRRVGGDIESLYDIPIVMFNTNKRWNTEDFIPLDDPNDDSMSRRAQIINFTHTIPVSVRDTELVAKLEKEKAGIFSWIVKGYMDLKINQFRMPENIDGKIELMMARAKATTVTPDGRKVMGSVSLWVQRCGIEPVPSEGFVEVVIGSTNLYHLYKRFCEMHGIVVCSIQRWGRDMGALEFGKRWVGAHDRSGAERNHNNYILYTGEPSVVNATPETRLRAFVNYKPSVIDDAKIDLFEGTAEISDEEYRKAMWGTLNGQNENENEENDN